MLKITDNLLAEAGACAAQRRLFRNLFPTGVTVTRGWCLRHAQEFDWFWAATQLLPTQGAWAIYETAMAPAWAVYGRATDPTRKACAAAYGVAALAQVETDHEATRAAGWASAAVEPAWAAYRVACAEAFATACGCE